MNFYSLFLICTRETLHVKCKCTIIGTNMCVSKFHFLKKILMVLPALVTCGDKLWYNLSSMVANK
jgi:hypothetical protein